MAVDQGSVQDAAGDAAATGLRPMRRNMARAGLRGVVIATVLSLGLSACAAIYRNHGYVPAEEDLAQVAVGSDTHESVAEKVGRPSAAGLLNDHGWYYVQSRYKHVGGREPVEIDRQVVAISFTDGGTVENIERFGLEAGRVVPISRRVTDTNIKGIGVLQQLFSNLGRVSADQILDD